MSVLSYKDKHYLALKDRLRGHVEGPDAFTVAKKLSNVQHYNKTESVVRLEIPKENDPGCLLRKWSTFPKESDPPLLRMKP